MESPLTNCPRCETLGPFRPQQRSVGDNIIEVFVRCTACNYVLVLRKSTVEIERLRRIRARWESYSRNMVGRYGVASSLATAQLRKIGRQIRELEDEIAEL